MSRASDRAYHQIRSMILSGTLPAGAQIREEQLAEACAVSRTPVRDALRRLEAELFVRRNDSQRSFVADWSPDDVEETFILRGMLEGMAAARAATNVTPEQLSMLRMHNVALHKAVRRTTPDIAAFLNHNRHFHAIILAAAGSERLSNMVTQVVEQPLVLRTALHYGRDNLLRSHNEHEELLAALERGDAPWAQAIMTAHIRRAYHAYTEAQAALRTGLIKPKQQKRS